MWTPYLDVAGQPANWVGGLLRAAVMDVDVSKSGDFSADRNQVLYNTKGVVVFRPKASFRCRIVSGIDKAGFVEVQDYDEARVCVFDKTGKMLFRAPNVNGRYLGDGVVAYDDRAILPEEDDRMVSYKLKDLKSGKEIGSVKCRSFSGSFEDNIVLCYGRSIDEIGVLGRSGKLILDMLYESKDYDPNYENIIANLAKQGFWIARKPGAAKWTLFDKTGKALLTNIHEVEEYVHPFLKMYETDESDSFSWQELGNGKATHFEAMDYILERPTASGNFMCFALGSDTVSLLNKTGKLIKALRVPSWRVNVLGEHHWVGDFKYEKKHICYDRLGAVSNTIMFDKIGTPKYGFVPFELDGLWGIANESGKVVMAPTFKNDSEEGLELMDGFFVTSTHTEEDATFDFYDFSGKRIMSSSSTKDGWDYIIPQKTDGLYYMDTY